MGFEMSFPVIFSVCRSYKRPQKVVWWCQICKFFVVILFKILTSRFLIQSDFSFGIFLRIYHPPPDMGIWNVRKIPSWPQTLDSKIEKSSNKLTILYVT